MKYKYIILVIIRLNFIQTYFHYLSVYFFPQLCVLDSVELQIYTVVVNSWYKCSQTDCMAESRIKMKNKLRITLK